MDMAKALEQIKEWLPGNDDFIQKIADLFIQACPKCPDTDDKDACALIQLKCLKDKVVIISRENKESTTFSDVQLGEGKSLGLP